MYVMSNAYIYIFEIFATSNCLSGEEDKVTLLDINQSNS